MYSSVVIVTWSVDDMFVAGYGSMAIKSQLDYQQASFQHVHNRNDQCCSGLLYYEAWYEFNWPAMKQAVVGHVSLYSWDYVDTICYDTSYLFMVSSA